MRPKFWLLIALFGAGCAIKPIDPWRRGAWALERLDLDAALGAFAEVPLEHLRYPESRTAAQAVRRTMLHCDELLRDALQLRSEGRDAEALALLRRTAELWPFAPGIDDLVAATERRQQLAVRSSPPNRESAPVTIAPAQPVAATGQDAQPGDSQPVLVARPEPPAPGLAPSSTGPVATAPTDGLASVVPPAAADSAPAGVPSLASPHAPQAAQPEPEAAATVGRKAAVGGDRITAALVAVEMRVVHGDRQAAIDELLALAQQYPGELRVRVRASRLLHQRALVRYGDGALADAIADWRRVLQLDPAHATAATLLQAAEREAQSISTRSK